MIQEVFSKKAPKAIGPYSQGIRYNDLIFVSGQLPINSDTGKLKSEIRDATAQCLQNLEAILIETGSQKDKILKITIFMTDLDFFKDMNEVYENFFTTNKPARSCVQVSSLPQNALIEIEAIAYL